MIKIYIFDLENFEKAKFREKSNFDSFTIKKMKDAKIIWKKSGGGKKLFSVYPLEKIEEIYLLLKMGLPSYQTFLNGLEGRDFEYSIENG